MIDRKKVIKGLKKCSMEGVDCKHCSYDGEGTQKYSCESVMEREALALLKEQPELVRCKDCKFVCMCDTTAIMPLPVYAICTLTDKVHEPDWFCADGERRGNE